MSDSGISIIGVLIPWAVGAQLSRLVLPVSSNKALTWGVGYFIGFLVTALILLAQQKLYGSLSFYIPAFILSTIGIVAWRVGRRNYGKATSNILIAPSHVYLYSGILVCLVVIPVVVDVFLRPLFPWDAWYTYALRAKVFSYFQQIVEFTSQHEWLETKREDVFNTNVRHGIFVPLVQTWIALGIGRWSESLVNLPWPGAWISISCLVGGMAYRAGNSIGLSFLAGALALTVPINMIFATLAGYAEPWLLGYLLLVLFALVLLRREPQTWGAVLLLIIGITGAIWTKQFAPILVGLLTAAWLLSMLPRQWQMPILALSTTTCSVITVYLATGATFDLYLRTEAIGEIGFRDGNLYIPGIRVIPIEDHGGAMTGLLSAIFLSKSFGLFGWLCSALILNNFTSREGGTSKFFLAHWLILCGFSAWWAISYTYLAASAELGILNHRILYVLMFITFALAISVTDRFIRQQEQ